MSEFNERPRSSIRDIAITRLTHKLRESGSTDSEINEAITEQAIDEELLLIHIQTFRHLSWAIILIVFIFAVISIFAFGSVGLAYWLCISIPAVFLTKRIKTSVTNYLATMALRAETRPATTREWLNVITNNRELVDRFWNAPPVVLDEEAALAKEALIQKNNVFYRELFTTYVVQKVCFILWIIYVLPPFMGLHAFEKRKDPSQTSLPLTSIVLKSWDIMFLGLCFFEAYRHHIITSVLCAAFCLLSVLVLLSLNFYPILSMRFRSQFPLFTLGKLLRLRELLWKEILAIMVFAVFYYSLSTYDSSSFSETLTVVDSIYFSVVTAFTVGYGDIAPVSAMARLLTAFHIIFSFVLNVILLAVFLSVWQKYHLSDTVEDKPDGKQNPTVIT